jgi:hypothetical protein
MRRVLLALTAALLLATIACSAAGGGGAPKASPGSSNMPTPAGSKDAYGY